MIYITGDTHGDFRRVESFCRSADTKKEDILIILGDAGINSSGEENDMQKKELLESLEMYYKVFFLGEITEDDLKKMPGSEE